MGRRAAQRLRHQLGRRGALLTLKGVIATLYGYGQFVQPPSDLRGLCLLLKWQPLDVWAGLWMAAGITALICAWLPPRRDWPGFLAVWGITAPWSMSYLVAWWPLGEYPRGWVAALIFGAFGGVCLVAIGWTEPSRAPSEPPRGT
ncbi:hypothetical protein OG481_02330 [Streptomyces longwoodensis]|uniref:hypothetical protein n=1 Tax=Streptomyces longwoodensis TaxID=68231 RepID=UPI002DD9FCCF|nr:hypothetical protein [Streptomyces longwoodensis]WRY87431.1 hypothetical protein OG481_02330 [Streptomyces longwoodensis]